MSDFDVDLFVIGAGSGGVRAARIASGYGARVMIAEEFRVGGTCVIRGCVPKKLMVIASRFTDDFTDAAGFGWQVGETRFDWSALIAAKDREIDRLERAYRANLERAGVELVESRAEIVDAHTVRLTATGQTLRAKRILVAVGARPSMQPAIPGMEHTITSNEVFDLAQQPERVLVIGAGYIAVEFAGIFAGLGSKTTLVHRGDKLLRGFDDDLRTRLGEACQARGIDVKYSTTPLRIEKQDDGTRVVSFSDGSTGHYDQVLLATGRVPATQGLGLENAGVLCDEIGAIVVDAYSRTQVPSIFAIGDVTNRANLTPVAIREGHAFADTEFGGKDVHVDHSLIPTAVFSTPEIGTVGLTETAARLRYEKVAIYQTAFRAMRATLSGREERVFMKIVVDAKTNKVLGIHLLGPDSGEMIQLAGVAVTMGATKADFDRTIAVHPSAAEELVTMREPYAVYDGEKPGLL
jgi:glutathione reductase (NADPH)